MTPRPRPSPHLEEVHVWRLELPGRDGRRAAGRALRAILAEYLGGAVELGGPAGGKPRLAEAPERLSFNLSHTAGLALIAVATGSVPVGIDVERLRPRRDLARLAGRWLPAADARAVAAAPDSRLEEVFYAAWTRHEARVKCTGTGLAGPPPGPEVAALQLPIDAGYAAAVAFDSARLGTTEPRLTIRTWPANEADGPCRP